MSISYLAAGTASLSAKNPLIRFCHVSTRCIIGTSLSFSAGIAITTPMKRPSISTTAAANLVSCCHGTLPIIIIKNTTPNSNTAVEPFSGAINFTLGVLAVFLFYGATLGGREHSYVSALSAGHKNYSAGVRERRVFISENAPLVRLFHHIDSRSVTTFAVVSDGGESDASPPVVRTLTEAELRAYAAAGRLSRTVASCMKGGAPEVPFRRRLPVRAGHFVGHFPRPRPREGRDS